MINKKTKIKKSESKPSQKLLVAIKEKKDGKKFKSAEDLISYLEK